MRYTRSKKSIRKENNFPLVVVKSWEKRIQKILTNNDLREREKFILKYAELVCEFRLAFLELKDTNIFSRKIDRQIKEGNSFELTPEDFQAINRVIRNKNEDELKQVHQLIRFKQRAKK